jgi:hypothetical protein
MSLFGIPATLIDLEPFWDALQARLAEPTLEAILGGSGRIYGFWDAIPDRIEENEGQWWATVAILPISTIWQQDDRPGRDELVRWLIRVDSHGPVAAGYRPDRTLHAAHARAFERIHGWLPGPMDDGQGNTVANGRLPAYRQTRPAPIPFWDNTRDVWYTSAEYRTLIESPDTI